MDKVFDRYNPIEKNDIGDLAGELDSLANLFDDGYLLLKLDDDTVGVCAAINTFSKSKSPLQRIEPIVIGVNLQHWQTVTPFVFSDRPDFPFEKFPHVNYEMSGLPPTFCLARENMDDWYAEHTLKDYVELVAQWLRDAAKGKLMKLTENDEFEPQRNHHVFENNLLRVTYMDSILENSKEAECYFYSIEAINNKPSVACGNEQHVVLNKNAVGVRLFAGSDHVDDTWYTNYPTTIRELYHFFVDKAYPLDIEGLKAVLDAKKEYVYFQYALLRPVKIIGKNTRINYMCFRAKAQDIISDNIDEPIEEVTIFDYTDYLTAQHLSLTPNSIFLKHIALLGCGAVGSKIAYHLHRSGICYLDLVDNDRLLPHNICRHALSAYHPGISYKNKAEAMKESLVQMFFGMPHEGIVAYNEEALKYLDDKDLNEVDLLIDATASVHVMRGIDSKKLPEKTRIVKVALSEGGDIGVTYINTDNSQLLSDYYMEILRNSLSNDQIYQWIAKEKKNSMEDVRIGEGCHSNTMRISDDTISAHAAVMSSAIRHLYEGQQQNQIILSFANHDFPGSMQTLVIPVHNYQQFNCENDTEWSVRIPKILLDSIRLKAKIANKKETGGYMFGFIDHKRKIIYPLEYFTPQDSHSTPTEFKLGTSGLKDYKKKISQRSADQLEYIGDWHSHPKTTLDMSAIDIATCQENVIHELPHGIGVCVITKTTQTKFFLISSQEKTYN